MRTSAKVRMLLVGLLVIVMSSAMAQRDQLQYFRSKGQDGVNVFETPKITDVEFDGLHLQVGGAFALQFQGISHENDNNNLVDLASNFNLATANLDLDAQLAPGMRMHLRTFLSSRHHTEAYVKGGYLQIDRLDFIKEGFASNLMDKLTVKIGHMETNYGDTHFRRSDNGNALYNPFVGNYIMDSYTTEVAGEAYIQSNGLLAMLGYSNGRLNQSTTNKDTKGYFYGKLGYDKQLNDDFRLRITGSFLSINNTNAINIYDGDRAGARYYHVMEVEGAGDNFRSGRIDPGYGTEMTSFMFNPFIKYQGLEFFGVFETASGLNETGADAALTENRKWTQTGGEVIYRFGESEKVYIGGRYNSVSGQLPGEQDDKVSVSRINIGGGWFLTKNVLTKLEYVSQTYKDYPTGNDLAGGKFSGVNLEAVIAF
jgi:hypothetical protein